MKRALVVVAATLVACSPKSDKPPPVAEQVVSAEGGTIEVTEGPLAGTKLEIPPGALAEGVTITVRPGKDIEVDGATRLGPAIEFGPPGTKFVRPVNLTLPFDAAALPAGADPRQVAVWVQETNGDPPHAVLTRAIDAEHGRVGVAVDGFTTFQMGWGGVLFSISFEPVTESFSNAGETWFSPAIPPLPWAYTYEGGHLDDARPPLVVTASSASCAGCTLRVSQAAEGGPVAEIGSSAFASGAASVSVDAARLALRRDASRNTWGSATYEVVQVHGGIIRQNSGLGAASFVRLVRTDRKPVLSANWNAEVSAGQTVQPAVIVDWHPGPTYRETSIAMLEGPSGATLTGGGPVAFPTDTSWTSSPSAQVAVPFSLTRAGDYTLEIRAGTLDPIQRTLTVVAAAPASLEFEGQPTGAIAGQPLPPVRVRLLDAFGNPANGRITLALTGGNANASLTGTTAKTATGDWVTFDDLRVDGAGQAYRLVASSTAPVPQLESAAFDIGAPTPAKLRFSQRPVDTVAHVAQQVVVEVTDAEGHFILVDGVHVSLTLGQNPGSATLAPAAQDTVNGRVTLPVALDTAASGYTLVASAPGLAAATSAAFAITAGPAARLRFDGFGFGAYSTTSSVPVSVSVVDQFDNRTSSTAAITLALAANPGNGTLSGTTTANAVGGVAALAFQLHRVGVGYTLQASSPGLASATSPPFEMVPGPPTKLAFTQAPTTGVINTALSPQPVVAATDQFDNPTSAAMGVVTLSVGGATVTSASASFVAGVATFSAAAIDQPGSYTLTASSTGLASTGTPLTIDPGPPTQLVVTSAPGAVVAGVPFSVTIELRDVNGFKTTAVNQVGAALTVNPGNDALAGTLTRAATAGVVTFSNLVLTKAATAAQLTFSSAGLSPAAAALDVTPAAVAKLAFVQQPTTAQAGASIAPAVGVELRDAFDNRVSTDGTLVTVALSVNPTSATLAGATTATTTQGRASFPGLSLAKAGSGYALAASSGTLTTILSDPFDITPGPAVSLAFVPIPTPRDAGSPLGVVVNTVDALGNVAPSTAAVTVTLASNPTGDVLLGTPTRAAVAGVATFDDLVLKKVGVGYTLAVSATGFTGAASNAFAIQAGPPAALRFGAVAVTRTAGSTGSLQAQVTDAAGNPLPGANITVTFALGANPGGTTLQGTTSVVTNAQGLASCSDCHVDVAAAGYTVTASASGLAQGASNAFDVVANAPHHIAFGVQPSSIVANSPFPSTVTVRWVDYLENPAVRDGDTVDLQLSATGPGHLSSSSATTTGGVASFPGLTVDRPGSYWLIATVVVGGVPTVAQSSTFTVSAGVPAKLQVVAGPSVVTACAQGLWRVEVQDGSGNRTNASVPISVSTSMVVPGGAVSGTTTVTSSNGVADFGDLSLDRSGTFYQLLFTSPGLAGGSSALITVLNGTPAKLAFTQQPADTPAGVSITPAPEVEVRDSCNNPLTPDGTPVVLALAANPAGATLTGGGSGPTTAGRVSFPALSLDRAGVGYVLSATSTGLGAATSAAFTVTPAVPTRLVFAAQPGPATAGAAFAAVHVQVRDSLGNLAASSTAPITLALSTNPTGDTLAGTLTRSAASGDAAFGDLVLTKASSGYALTASSPGLASATASGVTVTAGVPAKLAFSTQPPAGVQLLALPSAPGVALQDAWGNQAAGTNTVTLALLNAGGATLGGPMSQAASAGLATFPGLTVSLPGSNYQLSASASGLASASSSSFTVQPLSLVFTQAPANTQAGQSFQVQVELRAPGDVLAPVSTGVTLAMGNNPGGATLSGTLTRTASGGVATFPGLGITAAGTGYTLAATAAGMATAESPPITVASNAAQLAFTRLPATTPLDGRFDVEVSAQDGVGALATTFTGTVTLALTTDPTGSARLAGALSTVAVGGKALFKNLALDRNGAGFVVTASAAGLPNAQSAPFSVGAIPALDGLGKLSASGAFDPSRALEWETPWRAFPLRGMALDPVGHRLFVTAAPIGNDGDRLLVYNLSANDDFQGVDHVPDAVIGAADLWHDNTTRAYQFETRGGLAMDVTGRRLFVADWNGIKVYDLTSVGNDMAPALTFNGSCNFGAASITSFSDLEYDPATKRLFAACTGANRVLVYDANPATLSSGTTPSYVLGQPDFSTVTSGTTAAKLWSPTGLAFDAPANRLFVVDSGNHRVVAFSLASIATGMSASLVLGQVDFVSRATGAGAANFSIPIDAAVDSTRLYVVDRSNNRVLAFDLASVSNGASAAHVLGNTLPSTAYNTSTGLQASRLGTPPGGILAAGNRLYVADGAGGPSSFFGGRALVFDVSSITDSEDAVDAIGPVVANGGVDLTRFSGDPTSIASSSARGVVLDSTRHWLYVTANNKVLGFQLSAADDFVGHDRWPDRVIGQAAFGEYSSAAITNAQALALDEARNWLFVAGSAPDLSVWDLGQAGAAIATPLATYSGTTPNSATSWGQPSGLAWDPVRKWIFTAELNGYRVTVRDFSTATSASNIIAVLGQASVTDLVTATVSASFVRQPTGVAYDASGQRLFVAGGADNRVLVYDVSTVSTGQSAVAVLGQPLMTSSASGVSQSSINRPMSLAWSSADQVLFVADQYNCRVVAFDVNAITNGQAARTYFGQVSWTSRAEHSTSSQCDLSSQVAPSATSLGGPGGLAFGAASRRLWVGDPDAHRVLVYPVP